MICNVHFGEMSLMTIGSIQENLAFTYYWTRLESIFIILCKSLAWSVWVFHWATLWTLTSSTCDHKYVCLVLLLDSLASIFGGKPGLQNTGNKVDPSDSTRALSCIHCSEAQPPAGIWLMFFLFDALLPLLLHRILLVSLFTHTHRHLFERVYSFSVPVCVCLCVYACCTLGHTHFWQHSSFISVYRLWIEFLINEKDTSFLLRTMNFSSCQQTWKIYWIKYLWAWCALSAPLSVCLSVCLYSSTYLLYNYRFNFNYICA